MKRDQIVLVDYFNTIPFQKALFTDKFDDFDITPAIPAECSNLFFNKDADIALVPIASWIAHGSKEKIITDYCIGCDGQVGTVLLQSSVAVEDIQTIYLDNHSRTSVELLRLLCKEYWRIDPVFVVDDVTLVGLQTGEAKLMIGDKVFRDATAYDYSYDLGEVWKQYTGLPFVFAIWIVKDHISDQISETINQEFRAAFKNMPLIVEECKEKYPEIDLEKYFNSQISYALDEDKLSALYLFKEKLESSLFV